MINPSTGNIVINGNNRRSRNIICSKYLLFIDSIKLFPGKWRGEERLLTNHDEVL